METAQTLDIEIVPLQAEQVEEAGRVLGESLLVEPGYAAIMPDEAIRRRVLVSLLADGVRAAIAQQAVLAAVDETGRILGAAFWSPPRESSATPRPDGPPSLPPYLQELPPDQLQGLIAYDRACMLHFPDEPTWYLQILGVDPASQGRGVGSALMHASLAMVDASGLPAYLETGTERAVRFYERFGFEIREAGIQLAPVGPTHWTMIRQPRASGQP